VTVSARRLAGFRQPHSQTRRTMLPTSLRAAVSGRADDQPPTLAVVRPRRHQQRRDHRSAKGGVAPTVLHRWQRRRRSCPPRPRARHARVTTTESSLAQATRTRRCGQLRECLVATRARPPDAPIHTFRRGARLQMRCELAQARVRVQPECAKCNTHTKWESWVRASETA
jgi:hypothetical protein